MRLPNGMYGTMKNLTYNKGILIRKDGLELISENTILGWLRVTNANNIYIDIIDTNEDEVFRNIK